MTDLEQLDLLKSRLSKLDKNSRDYKTLLASIIRIECTNEFDSSLSKGGYLTSKDLSDFCSERKEYGSENYIRAIIVPMVLENYGPEAIK